VLEARNLSVSYGKHRALENVSVRVGPGEIVVILGANGAGKSTLLRTIGGVCEGTHSGTVEIDGRPILGLPPHRIVERGIAMVPEGRGVFADLTVRENLLLGAYLPRGRADQPANLERVFGLFPKLAERRSQTVRTMSGGEQQMVAIGRAIMSAPSILMLDEPSLGLSPILCTELFHSLTEVRRVGLGILLVEQNAKQSLAIADRGYLLENARIKHEDSAANLANDPAVQKAYLGAGTDRPAPAATAGAPAAHEPTPSQIAAAALARLPYVATSGGQGGARRSADELISGSIDDLVRRAAKTQAKHVEVVRGAAGGTRPAGGGAARSSERLRSALAEIERAARDARLGTAPPTAPEQAKNDRRDKDEPGNGSGQGKRL
jgi:branched-chain amino acid transport system ATP-binding protein